MPLKARKLLLRSIGADYRRGKAFRAARVGAGEGLEGPVSGENWQIWGSKCSVMLDEEVEMAGEGKGGQGCLQLRTAASCRSPALLDQLVQFGAGRGRGKI